MGIYEANGHCGTNGHIGTNGHWGLWALGSNEHWGENGHQNNWAFMRQMGTVEQMGTSGPIAMDIGAVLGN